MKKPQNQPENKMCYVRNDKKTHYDRSMFIRVQFLIFVCEIFCRWSGTNTETSQVFRLKFNDFFGDRMVRMIK